MIIPTLSSNLVYFIEEELNKVKSANKGLNINPEFLTDAQRQYLDRPYSRSCAKLGRLFGAVRHKASQFRASADGAQNPLLKFERGRGKNKGNTQLIDMLENLLKFVMKGTGYQHPDDIPPQGGCYNMMNNLAYAYSGRPVI